MKKQISFFVGNETLRGTLIIPNNLPKTLSAILFIHGWTSSEIGYIPRAQAVSKLGFICMTFNMRGHGVSDGNLENLSRKDHLDDCIAAYDYLVAQPGIDPKHIHVVGASYGGYMASMLSAKRQVASLVLRAPALYPDDQFLTPTLHLIRKDIQIYRQIKLSYQENKALTGLHSYNGNILLVESEFDDDVPKSTTDNFAHAVHDPRTLTRVMLPESDHRLSQPLWKQKFIDAMVSWFSNQNH